MSTAHINSKLILQEIINEEIFITGDITQQKEELYHNTWQMWFEKEFLKTLSLVDLQDFLEKLIQKRSQQTIEANKGYTTFYLWYSGQSATLCFDILSGKNIKLPFGCTVNIVHNPDIILSTFLKEEQADITPLSFENFKFFEPGDPGWDEFDNDDEDEEEYVLDVYVTVLPQSKIEMF